jgi:hypothetical protein
MHISTAWRLTIGLVFATVLNTAGAQPTPPIKSGLWQMQVDRPGAGAEMAQMQAKLAAMPPEQRAMVESMMKQRGVDIGSGGYKICIDRESLAKGRWYEGQGRHAAESGCKTDIVERGASRWRWHSTCTSPEVVSDGEATFDSSEAYTVSVDSTVTADNMPRKTHTTMHAKWLGADCGDIKPVRSAGQR